MNSGFMLLHNSIHSMNDSHFVSIDISQQSCTYTCVCGMKVSLSDKETHLRSLQHLRYLEYSRTIKECDICVHTHYQDVMYACETCKQTHCESCHYQMDKCPFCRATFPITHLELLFQNTIQQHLFYLENTRRHHDMSVAILKQSIDTWHFMYSKPKYKYLLEKVLEVLERVEVNAILQLL